MARQRRYSRPSEPAPQRWTVSRRLVLTSAANDNRLPAALRVLRAAAVASVLAVSAWLIALAT